MKPHPEIDALLEDLLSEPDARFEDSALTALLQRARSRQHSLHWRQFALFAAAAGLAIGFAWRLSRPFPAPTPHRSECPIVQTHSLPNAFTVHTATISPDMVVVTQGPLPVVRTQFHAGDIIFLNDEQLLALMAPGRAILIRVGPHEEKLITLPDGDRAGPVN